MCFLWKGVQMRNNESLITILKADLSRIITPTLKSFLKCYFFTRGGVFRFTVWFRITMCVKSNKLLKWLFPVVYIVYRHYTYKYGVHIDTNIPIGKGLLIVHGDGVHINCNQIGDNFTIYQNVTIGVDKTGKPIIGDNVTIFPGAVVSGGIEIRDGCIVGANSFVNKTVDSGLRVAGVPAKCI